MSAFDQVKEQWINPLYREGIGRRTGRALHINAGRDSEGFENFSDYWTDSIDSDVSDMIDKENDISKITESDKQKGGDAQNRKMSSPLKPMQSFASSGKSSVTSSSTIRASSSSSSNLTTHREPADEDMEPTTDEDMEPTTDEDMEPTTDEDMEPATDKDMEPAADGSVESTMDEHTEPANNGQGEPATDEHKEPAAGTNETSDKSVHQEKSIKDTEKSANRKDDTTEPSTAIEPPSETNTIMEPSTARNPPSEMTTTTPVPQESLNEADITGSIICSQVSQEPNSALRQFKTKKRLTFTSSEVEKEIMSKKNTSPRKSPRIKKSATNAPSSDEPEGAIMSKETDKQDGVTDKCEAEADGLDKPDGVTDKCEAEADGLDNTLTEGGSDTPTKRSSDEDKKSTIKKQPRKSSRLSVKADGKDTGKSPSKTDGKELTKKASEKDKDIVQQGELKKQPRKSLRKSSSADVTNNSKPTSDLESHVEMLRKDSHGNDPKSNKSRLEHIRKSTILQESMNDSGEATRFITLHKSHHQTNGVSAEDDVDDEEDDFEIVEEPVKTQKHESRKTGGRKAAKRKAELHDQEKDARKIVRKSKRQDVAKNPETEGDDGESEEEEAANVKRKGKRGTKKNSKVGKGASSQPDMVIEETDAIVTGNSKRNKRNSKVPARPENDEEEGDDGEAEVQMTEEKDTKITRNSKKNKRNSKVPAKPENNEQEEKELQKTLEDNNAKVTRNSKRNTRNPKVAATSENNEQTEYQEDEDVEVDSEDAAKRPVRPSRRSMKPTSGDKEGEGETEVDPKKVGKGQMTNSRANRKRTTQNVFNKSEEEMSDEGHKDGKRKTRSTRTNKGAATTGDVEGSSEDKVDEEMSDERHKDGKRKTRNTRTNKGTAETDDVEDSSEDKEMSDKESKRQTRNKRANRKGTAETDDVVELKEDENDKEMSDQGPKDDGKKSKKGKKKGRSRNIRQDSGESKQESDEQGKDTAEEQKLERKTRTRGREVPDQESEDNLKVDGANKGRKHKAAKSRGKKVQVEEKEEEKEEDVEMDNGMNADGVEETPLESQEQNMDEFAPDIQDEASKGRKRKATKSRGKKVLVEEEKEENVEIHDDMNTNEFAADIQDEVVNVDAHDDVNAEDIEDTPLDSHQSMDGSVPNAESEQFSDIKRRNSGSRSRKSFELVLLAEEIESERLVTKDGDDHNRSVYSFESSGDAELDVSHSVVIQELDPKRLSWQKAPSELSPINPQQFESSKSNRTSNKSNANKQETKAGKEKAKSSQRKRKADISEVVVSKAGDSDTSEVVAKKVQRSEVIAKEKGQRGRGRSKSSGSTTAEESDVAEVVAKNKGERRSMKNSESTSAGKSDMSEVVAKKVQKSEVIAKNKGQRGKRKNSGSTTAEESDNAEVVTKKVQKSEVIAKNKGQRGRRKNSGSTSEDTEQVQPDESDGLRRTKRTRVPTLEYWRNEKPHERRKSDDIEEQAESELQEANSLSHDMLESEDSHKTSSEEASDRESENRLSEEEEEKEERRASCVMKMGKQGTTEVSVHVHEQEGSTIDMQPDKTDSHKKSHTPLVSSTDPTTTPKSILKRTNSRMSRNNRRLTLKFFEQPKNKAYLVQPDESDPVNGLRRTKRTRVHTLEYWRNERPLYERRKSGGFALVGVMSPPNKEKTPKKKKPRKKAMATSLTPRNVSMHVSPPPKAKTVPSKAVTVLNPETEEEVEIDAIVTSEMHHYVGPSGKVAEPDDPITVCKCLHQPAFSSGILKLRPFKEKSTQLVRRNTMVFYIVKGKLAVTIHNTTQILQTGDSFFVPQGNVYNIKNLRKDEAKLKFFQLKNG